MFYLNVAGYKEEPEPPEPTVEDKFYLNVAGYKEEPEPPEPTVEDKFYLNEAGYKGLELLEQLAEIFHGFI